MGNPLELVVFLGNVPRKDIRAEEEKKESLEAVLHLELGKEKNSEVWGTCTKTDIRVEQQQDI